MARAWLQEMLDLDLKRIETPMNAKTDHRDQA
jgi:hypothetical protein